MKYTVNFKQELRKNPFPGLYIALEGIDGSGKTTQAELIGNYFREQGREVVITAEPTRVGVIGELVHKVLRNELVIPRKYNQYLFSIDRGIHQDELIIPSLKAGKVVISDRSFWSTLAYGIFDKESVDGKTKDRDLLLVMFSILSLYHQFIVPDKSIYLDITLETAAARLSNLKRSREFYEDAKMLVRVKEIYEEVVKKFKKSFVQINGNLPKEKVLEEILKKVKK